MRMILVRRIVRRFRPEVWCRISVYGSIFAMTFHNSIAELPFVRMVRARATAFSEDDALRHRDRRRDQCSNRGTPGALRKRPEVERAGCGRCGEPLTPTVGLAVSGG